MARTRPLNVFLLRAGPTAWDRQARLVGCTDLPLAEDARTDVIASLAPARGERLDWILAGPEESTLATAHMLAEVTGGRTRALPALRDASLGLWEGQTWAELAKRCPQAHRLLLHAPETVLPPGGERLIDATDRLTAAIDAAAGRANARLGVVLRPLAYGLLRCLASGAGWDKVWEFASDPAPAGWTALPHERQGGAAKRLALVS